MNASRLNAVMDQSDLEMRSTDRELACELLRSDAEHVFVSASRAHYDASGHMVALCDRLLQT
jgi:hypothetical protein